MLAKAAAELKQSDFAGAQASAEVARAERRQGDRAAETALRTGGADHPEQGARRGAGARRPRSQRHRRPPGAAGDLQRLVIAVPDLFSEEGDRARPRARAAARLARSADQQVPDLPGPGHRPHGQSRQSLANCWRFRRRARSRSTTALASRGVETRRLTASAGRAADDNKIAVDAREEQPRRDRLSLSLFSLTSGRR